MEFVMETEVGVGCEVIVLDEVGIGIGAVGLVAVLVVVEGAVLVAILWDAFEVDRCREKLEVSFGVLSFRDAKLVWLFVRDKRAGGGAAEGDKLEVDRSKPIIKKNNFQQQTFSCNY